jgi:hypothetical protein
MSRRVAIAVALASATVLLASVAAFAFLIQDMLVPGYVPRSRPDLFACLVGVTVSGLAFGLAAACVEPERPYPPATLGRPRY